MRTYSLSEWEEKPLQSNWHPDGIPERDALNLYREARLREAELRLGRGNLLEFHRSGLRAGQVVGVIVAGDCRLEILPKVDDADAQVSRRSLFQMLARTMDLRLSSSGVTSLGSQDNDLLEILIRHYANLLYRAVHRGLPRSYNVVEADLGFLKGQLNVSQQFTRLAATPQRLACRYDELNPDTPLNQILKAVVTQLLKATRNSQNKRLLAELRYAFDEVSDLDRSQPLPLRQVHIDRTNAAYKELFNMAVLFLGGWRQSLYRGEGRGFSLLFEMNVLFEEFIGRCLRGIGSKEGFAVALQGPYSHVLRDEVGVRAFGTKPDIHLQRNGKTIVVDTKWKRLKHSGGYTPLGISSSDVYQMMTYADVYSADAVVLLYPHTDEMSQAPGILKRFTTLTSGRKVLVATVCLSDISSIDEQLSKILTDLTVGHV